jgi:RNA recognition motif-containing protein
LLLSEIGYMKSIYVGNLPFTATGDEVRDLFSPFGNVDSVRLMTDRDTGRPRGFGFVKMAAADADAAIKALDGQSLGGRSLRINEAEERKPGGGGGGYGGGGRSDNRW